jgi:hypothetical protein
MKSIIYLILLTILLFPNFNYSQKKLFDEEITLYVEGFTNSPTVTYSLESVGTVWANSTISTSYNLAQENVVGNAGYSDHRGWIIFWELVPPYEPFAHGFYKLKTSINTNYVYLDFRDCQFANQNYTPSYVTDFALKYNGLTDEFSYMDGSASTFTPIMPKSVVKIGDIKNGNAVTTCFDNYWSNCLIIIPSQTGNHPRLVWGPYPSSSITIQAYKVYRKYGSSPFVPCTTLSASTYQFTDESVYLSIPGGQAGTDVQYKVTAVYNTNNESSPTNIVTVNIQGDEIEKRSYSIPVVIDNYQLDQNYPNPFNPSTIINYTLINEGLVKIKVFDILGSEVVELVSETKAAGEHSIEFKVGNLPNGVYIYTLQVNGDTKSKKMLLLK